MSVFAEPGKVAIDRQAFNGAMCRHAGRVAFAYRHREGCPSEVWIGWIDEHRRVSGDRRIAKYANDPRLHVHRGRLYCSYSTATGGWAGVNMRMAVLDDELNCLRDAAIDVGPPPQKNCVLFSKDEHLYCVIWPLPPKIVRISPDGLVREGVPAVPGVEVPEWIGTGKASASLTRVGDEYHGWFHRYEAKREWAPGERFLRPRRCYYMGAYAISADPLGELLRVSSRPLIGPTSARTRDQLIFGAIRDPAGWWLSLGVHNDYCDIRFIAHDEVAATWEASA